MIAVMQRSNKKLTSDGWRADPSPQDCGVDGACQSMGMAWVGKISVMGVKGWKNVCV